MEKTNRRASSPCFRAPSPARIKEISLESTMWCAPSSRRNRTPEILCPLRGPFSQASLKPCSTMGEGGRNLNLESLPLVFKTYSVRPRESVCMPFQQLAQTALGRWFQQFDLQTPVWCNGLTREARGPRWLYRTARSRHSASYGWSQIYERVGGTLVNIERHNRK